LPRIAAQELTDDRLTDDRLTDDRRASKQHQMHAAVGLLILIGAAAFVVFAFRQGQGVRRDRREDDQSAVGIGRDGGFHHPDGGGIGHG
jgi:hypothetical protein